MSRYLTGLFYLFVSSSLKPISTNMYNVPLMFKKLQVKVSNLDFKTCFLPKFLQDRKHLTDKHDKSWEIKFNQLRAHLLLNWCSWYISKFSMFISNLKTRCTVEEKFSYCRVTHTLLWRYWSSCCLIKYIYSCINYINLTVA